MVSTPYAELPFTACLDLAPTLGVYSAVSKSSSIPLLYFSLYLFGTLTLYQTPYPVPSRGWPAPFLLVSKGAELGALIRPLLTARMRGWHS